MRQKLTSAVAAIGLLAVMSQASHAALMLSLSDGTGDSVVLTDQNSKPPTTMGSVTFFNSPAGDANPTLGGITFAGSLGSFVINLTTGVSKPIMGTVQAPQLHLDSVDVTGTTGGSVTISLTDTDFTGTGPAEFNSLLGGVQGTGGSISFATYMDCTNTPFGQSPSGQLANLSTSNSLISASATTNTTLCGTYSLTEVAMLALPDGGKTTSFNGGLAIPEPASLAIFGVGLIAVCGALRCQKHRHPRDDA